MSQDATQAMVSALLVLTRDPKIRMWLKDNDPKALEQAEKALTLVYRQASDIRELFHGHRPRPQNACEPSHLDPTNGYRWSDLEL